MNSGLFSEPTEPSERSIFGSVLLFGSGYQKIFQEQTIIEVYV